MVLCQNFLIAVYSSYCPHDPWKIFGLHRRSKNEYGWSTSQVHARRTTVPNSPVEKRACVSETTRDAQLSKKRLHIFAMNGRPVMKRHQSVMTQFSCLCLLVSLPSKCRNQQRSPPHGRRQGRSSFMNDSAKEMEMLFTTFFFLSSRRRMSQWRATWHGS
jgi:hypothetical protein